MVMFPPNHLQCVVALARFVPNKDEEGEWTEEILQTAATGFLYAFPRSGKLEGYTENYSLWLVTCKHVIEQIRGGGTDKMVVRMNQKDQHSMRLFQIPLKDQENVPRWYLHPTKDIAVIPTSWQDLEEKNVRWEIFAAGRNAITRDDASANALSEGETVFILGFPLGWREGRQDYPIVRHGVLAQTQGWLKGEHETFLVDGSGFGGNSGGPVVVVASHIQALIGMVSASKMRPLIPGLKETADLKETLDLIEIIPMEAINETIQFAIQQRPDSA